MSTQPYRTQKGGLVDRTQPINFTFGGNTYQGFQGRYAGIGAYGERCTLVRA